jgi:hypothetical protein
MKFVKWLFRKSRTLTMVRQDDDLNEFIEEVTDGTYTLPCCEVILKLVKIKISITTEIWNPLHGPICVLWKYNQHRIKIGPICVLWKYNQHRIKIRSGREYSVGLLSLS